MKLAVSKLTQLVLFSLGGGGGGGGDFWPRVVSIFIAMIPPIKIITSTTLLRVLDLAIV